MIDMINVGKKVTKVCYVTEKDESPVNSKRYYKDWEAWSSGHGICYIPDCEVSEYGHDGIVTEEEINTWGVGYTKEDLMQEMDDVLREEYELPFDEFSESMCERIGEMIFTLLRGDALEACVRRNISGIFNIYNGLC